LPELRKDPVLGRWVIIATERAKRPKDFTHAPPVPPAERACPFCPGNEELTPPEISRRPGPLGWAVRVVPNRFPALDSVGPATRQGSGIYDRVAGVGAHEVIIDSPAHDRQLADLSADELAGVVAAWRERACALEQDKRLRYVLIFKNHGPAAGASLEHSHCQLIATPVLPVLVKSELDGAQRYHRFRSRCVYCDMLKQERTDKARLVAEHDGFLTFAPFAPRFPFETWLLPLEHFGSFAALDERRVSGLARALKDALDRMNRVLDRPDYNFVVHCTPLDCPDAEHYHFHIELMPKLTIIAGFEVGTGFYINPVPPEDAAAYLRGEK